MCIPFSFSGEIWSNDSPCNPTGDQKLHYEHGRVGARFEGVPVGFLQTNHPGAMWKEEVQEVQAQHGGLGGQVLEQQHLLVVAVISLEEAHHQFLQHFYDSGYRKIGYNNYASHVFDLFTSSGKEVQSFGPI